MDELVALCETADVSGTSWADSTKQPRLSQWKSKTAKMGDQKKRRQLFLERQKAKREDQFDQRRRTISENQENEPDEKMETKTKKERKVYEEYENLLMQSEWLVDIPEVFSDWLVKVVPFGKRRILDAQFGRTTLYDKKGRQTNRFWTDLPGGNKRNNTSQTLLDGIYNEIDRTFYILDVIVWDGYDYSNCDTNFRFYWVEQKYAELQDRGNLSLALIPYRSLDTLQQFISQDITDLFGYDIYVDGLLFYHNEVHYIGGVTPLVGWLKPEMINEQFQNIQPHPSFTKEILNDKRHQPTAPEKLLSKSDDTMN